MVVATAAPRQGDSRQQQAAGKREDRRRGGAAHISRAHASQAAAALLTNETSLLVWVGGAPAALAPRCAATPSTRTTTAVLLPLLGMGAHLQGAARPQLRPRRELRPRGESSSPHTNCKSEAQRRGAAATRMMLSPHGRVARDQSAGCSGGLISAPGAASPCREIYFRRCCCWSLRLPEISDGPPARKSGDRLDDKSILAPRLVVSVGFSVQAAVAEA